MAFLFKSKPKSAQEVVTNLKESLAALDKKDIKKKDILKAQEAIAADVALMKFLLYGDLERPVKPDTVNQLYDAVQAAEVLGPLVLHLVHYDSGVRRSSRVRLRPDRLADQERGRRDLQQHPSSADRRRPGDRGVAREEPERVDGVGDGLRHARHRATFRRDAARVHSL